MQTSPLLASSVRLPLDFVLQWNRVLVSILLCWGFQHLLPVEKLQAQLASSEDASIRLDREFKLVDVVSMPFQAPSMGRSALQFSYPDFDAIEWRVQYAGYQSEGTFPLQMDRSDSVQLQSADFEIEFPTDEDMQLEWSRGSHSETIDFRPERVPLRRDVPVLLESFGGRSSDGVMPYLRIRTDEGGIVLAIGWAGDWKMEILPMGDARLRIKMGMRHTHFPLESGESVPLPSLLMMSYRGGDDYGRNRFRRLMRKHFSPQDIPVESLMPVAASVHGMFSFDSTSSDELVRLADHLGTLGLPIDVFWLDAGWNSGGFPRGQGNPDSDPIRFPKGLTPVGEAVARNRMKFLAWFEPERAMRGTWQDRMHPEQLLQPSNTPEDLRYLETDGFRLLDLGNSESLSKVTERISNEIHAAKIAIYRQDFNLYPRYFWATDKPNEHSGRREAKHIQGLLELWDQLRSQHPGLLIDNCASGGRRVDFESLKRSVVLWRSDSCWDDKTYPRNVQAMTYGLSHWLPYHGLGSVGTDVISLRSGMGTCATFAIDYRNNHSVEVLRGHLGRYLDIKRLFAEDFYPLSDFTVENDEWLAFQFHDPESGDGVIQAFRGPAELPSEWILFPRGLEPRAVYQMDDWDQMDSPRIESGAQMMTKGIRVRQEKEAVAKVLRYRMIQQQD